MLDKLLDFSYIHVIALFLALLPALGWIYIFNKKHHESRKAITITFLVGILSTFFILIYQFFWDNSFNFIFLNIEPVNFKQSIVNLFDFGSSFRLKMAVREGMFMAILATFFIFIGVGAMEEYVKHWVVKKFDRPFFRSIDDVIELSIVAALGFAFFENIVYFITKWEYLNSLQFGVFVFFRVTVVTMVHVLCSGIFGYFYGLAYFAHPVLKDEEKAKKKLFFTNWVHKVLHLKKETIFRDEKIMEGLILAVLIHAIYDFILEINWTVGDLLSVVGISSNINIGIYIFMMPLYLIGGYLYLSYLLDKKEGHKKYGKLYIREEFSNTLEAKLEYEKAELEDLRGEKEAIKEEIVEEKAEEKELEATIKKEKEEEKELEATIKKEKEEEKELEATIKKEKEEEVVLEKKKEELEKEVAELEKEKEDK